MGAIMLPHAHAQATTEQATFAGGCFWCMAPVFEQLGGITEVVVGYTGGTTAAPTYEDVSSGTTGHVEAIQLTFDPAQVSYSDILKVYWKNIDPTDTGGQFVDRGSQYRTAIFYHNADQRRQAEHSKAALESSGRFRKPIATMILPEAPFYRAEEYHQDYHKKNPARYELYKSNSGRKQLLADPTQTLTPLQCHITQDGGTEPPFNNAYWDNHREGIYVDIVSGDPLFSSMDKFDSGSGWPSFTRPITKGSIVERMDSSHMMTRVEVRSKNAGSHLGHVFPNGPGPGGLRYCINSASLRFIPKEDLVKEGYGEYLKYFK